MRRKKKFFFSVKKKNSIIISTLLIIIPPPVYYSALGIKDSSSVYFGLEIGNETFVYAVLPMGWSWSPRLAQSASMAILLEAATRAKLIDPADYANLDNPPSMIRMRGGCATVWYDNVIGIS